MASQCGARERTQTIGQWPQIALPLEEQSGTSPWCGGRSTTFGRGGARPCVHFVFVTGLVDNWGWRNSWSGVASEMAAKPSQTRTERRMRKRDRRERAARDRLRRCGCAAKRRSRSEATRAASRRVPCQHSDRDHEVHARPARARARSRWVLPRAAEDAGRRGREPRRRRVADQRRQAVLRLLDGPPVRRGVQRHEPRARPTSRADGDGAVPLRLQGGLGADDRVSLRRSAAAGSSCASSTRRTASAPPSSRRSCSAARTSDGSRSACADEPEGGSWWRIALVEAIARHAALALHKSRCTSRSALEERRKAILEERNRLARDIHDNLAQGFGAILMQLQAAQREGTPPAAGGRAQHRHRRRSRAHAHGRSAAIGRRASSQRRRRRGHRAGDQARRRARRRRRPTFPSTSTSTSCRASATASSAR